MKIMNIVLPSAGDCRRDRHPLGFDGRVEGRGMIPPELEERRVREAWFNAIPWSNIDRPEKSAKDKITRAAIILPPPPAPLLIQFFASITPHLTAKQLRARTCYGRPGVRRDLLRPSPRKRSKARAKPSLPPCRLPHAETCAMLPELLPE